MTDGYQKPKKPTRSTKSGQSAPGTSENRGGGPAKKHLRIEEYALAALEQKIKTTLNGKVGHYSLAEIIGTSIAHDAAKGSKHAREMLSGFQTKFAPPSEKDIFGFIWP